MSEYTPDNLTEVAKRLCKVWTTASHNYLSGTSLEGHFAAYLDHTCESWQKYDEDEMSFLVGIVKAGIAEQVSPDDQKDRYVVDITEEYDEQLKAILTVLTEL